ncbi:MAG: response regulator transcription factor [Clostridia bacterium]|nr:response regulator transcription factor [Clostridia bacterium]
MNFDTLIYIVEDDEGIGEVYLGALEDSYRVDIFATGGEFFTAFDKRRPDLIILDIMLPDMDGYQILSRIRECDERVPVIIVSAKSDEISFVKGLNRGADDYMAKPFSVLELLARVKAGLRRANLYVKVAGNFTVDNNTYRAAWHGQDLGLTLKEFKLLRMLIGRSGVTVSREELFREVWGEEFMGESRTLDMHMATLREKISTLGAPECIVTVRGIGYRFESV